MARRFVGLEITLAGEITIRDEGGDRLPLRRARARVAFALLTVERSRGVPRDVLAEAVWPSGVPRTWESALRNVVSDVRAFVTQVLPAGTDPVLASTGRYKLLLPEDVLVDVELAEGAVGAAQMALAAGDARRAHDLAGRGTGVLRAPFLPDHDADWVLQQQSRLGELLLLGLEATSQAAAALGDGAAALAAADEAIARDALRESAHRCRMAAHAVAGNRAAALQAYQHLRRLLADEYGTNPSPETEEAYIALLGPAPVPGEAGPGGSAGGPGAGGGTGGRAGAALPFVGRQAELAALAGAWDRTVAERRCHVALVTGDTGIGKTQLVTRAARHVSAGEGLVLLGRCDRDPTTPYQPFVEMLDGLVAETPEDELPRLDPVARAELAAVFPSFPARAAPGPGPGPEATIGSAGGGAGPAAPPDRGRLFDAVADLLVGATVDRAVAMVLDDLQWADEDTLLLLRHVLRRARDVPLLVVAVARDAGELARPLGDVTHTAERDGRLERIDLDGLAEPDVRALVERLRPDAGGDPDRLARRLLSDTAGNPFMLVELLRDGRDGGTGGDRAGGAGGAGAGGAGVPTPLAGGGVPSGVQDLVEDKLAGLEPAGRDLLRAAAVAGTAFELDLVAAAADLGEMAALDALDAALASRLVAEGWSGPGLGPPGGLRYRFTHEIVQRRLYDQLSGPRRRLLHARLADAIEARRAERLDDYTALLARHRTAAAGPDGDPEAVRWARAAARRAGERRAVAEVLRLHRQALDHVPADDPGLRAEVLVELGQVQVEAGEPEGERTLLDAAALARRSARLDIAARAVLGIADLARAATPDTDPTATPRHHELRAEARTLVEDVLHELTTAPAAVRHPPTTATGAPEPSAADASPPAAAGAERWGPADPLVHARLVARHVQLGTGRAAGLDPDEPRPFTPPGVPDQGASLPPEPGPSPGPGELGGRPPTVPAVPPELAATAGWALPALGDHLATLAGPAHLEERLAIADDLAAVAAAADDREQQALARHHRAMVQATTAGGPLQADLRPGGGPAGAGGGRPAATVLTAEGPATPAELLVVEREIAVATTQGRFDDAWTAARLLAAHLGDAAPGAASEATAPRPSREAPDDRTMTTGPAGPARGTFAGAGDAVRGIAPAPGAVAGRQVLVAWWLQGTDAATPEQEQVLLRLREATGGGGRMGDDPAEQALVALVRGDRGRGRVAARAAAQDPTSLPGGDRWLHSVGLLALVAVELGDPAIAAATYDLLAPHAGRSCGVGYRSFVGSVTFHLGRLAAVAGDHADAERQLVAALQEHSDSRARPWIALTQHALADALEARSRAYDRDWVTVLRGESQSLAKALGLRPLG